MHRIKEIDVDVPVPNTSLSSYFFGCHLLIYLCNTNCLEAGQDQWIPKALFSYFSKKMLAVGSSNGRHSGPKIFKPEKNLVFFSE